MAGKVAKWSPDVMRYVEKSILLQTLDHLWREHLVMLEHLRQVIGLRGYGQRDPLNEYKAEAFSLFEAMVAHLREAVTAQLMRVEVVQSPPAEEPSKLPYMEAHKVDPQNVSQTIRRAGARLDATSLVPAGRARSSSIATANSADAVQGRTISVRTPRTSIS
jgi:preprotein translocase subunit SecA